MSEQSNSTVIARTFGGSGTEGATTKRGAEAEDDASTASVLSTDLSVTAVEILRSACMGESFLSVTDLRGGGERVPFSDGLSGPSSPTTVNPPPPPTNVTAPSPNDTRGLSVCCCSSFTLDDTSEQGFKHGESGPTC